MRRRDNQRTDLRSKRAFGKAICTSLTVALLLGGVAGGTYAWLIADTKPVVNTFTYGDIDLKLEETRTDEKGNPIDSDNDGAPDITTEGNTYEMVPGEEYLKNPFVTVLAGNEACWLFVKLEEEGGIITANTDGSTNIVYDFDDYLSYEVADGWMQLKDENGAVMEGIYFRYVGEDTDDIEAVYEILKDNKISVQGTVTKEMLNALDKNGAEPEYAFYPSLSITAYAVQYSGFEAEVNEGATEPTVEQANAAALPAWKAVEEQNAVTNP